MPPDPVVSVVIPAYNAEKTIGNAIDSVLEQTMSDLEVIVVDDASTDGTVHVVEAAGDPRVRLLRGPRNCGPAVARNLGVKRATGRWVTFLDADDEYVPSRLEGLLEAAAGDCDCFVADWIVASVPDPGGRLAPLRLPTLPAQPLAENFEFTDYLKLAMDVMPIVPRATLTRHHIEFSPWAHSGEWAPLIARLCAMGIRGRLLHRVGYLYRVTGTHRSSTLRGIEEQLKATEFLAADADVPEAAKEILRQGIPGTRRRLVVAALREGKLAKFACYARRNPTDLVWLPASVLCFLWRQVRYRVASLSSRPA